MTTLTPCDHDKRFSGVFDLPKGTNGCLACAYEKSISDLAAAQEALAKAARFRLKAHQILLPDPYDERDVSAEWQVKAIRDTLAEG